MSAMNFIKRMNYKPDSQNEEHILDTAEGIIKFTSKWLLKQLLVHLTGNVRWYKDMCRTPLTFLQKDVGAKRDAKHKGASVLKTNTVVDLVAIARTV